MNKQLNLLRVSSQVKELMRASFELRTLANKIESQAHQINRKEHPELMQKRFCFTQDWDIHIIGETEQGTMTYLEPEQEESKLDEAKKDFPYIFIDNGTPLREALAMPKDTELPRAFIPIMVKEWFDKWFGEDK
jgi:hypothetical protein